MQRYAQQFCKLFESKTFSTSKLLAWMTTNYFNTRCKNFTNSIAKIRWKSQSRRIYSKCACKWKFIEILESHSSRMLQRNAKLSLGAFCACLLMFIFSLESNKQAQKNYHHQKTSINIERTRFSRKPLSRKTYFGLFGMFWSCFRGNICQLARLRLCGLRLEESRSTISRTVFRKANRDARKCLQIPAV